MGGGISFGFWFENFNKRVFIGFHFAFHFAMLEIREGSGGHRGAGLGEDEGAEVLKSQCGGAGAAALGEVVEYDGAVLVCIEEVCIEEVEEAETALAGKGAGVDVGEFDILAHGAQDEMEDGFVR